MNKWQCILTISLSFLLSFAFIYKHHFDPQRAYAKILRIGFFQSTMPFENTQKSLVKNIPSYQKVNLGLLPASPTYFKVDKKSLVYDERQDKLIQNSEIFLKEGALIFHKTELNNSELFVGRGFYKTEARHIWSRKQSQILIQNKNQLVKLTLESFVADNKVRIAFNDTVHNFTLNNKGTFVIDLSGFSRDWVLIEFSAEKSGRPSKITPKSNDNRDLSFSIRLGKSQTL